MTDAQVEQVARGKRCVRCAADEWYAWKDGSFRCVSFHLAAGKATYAANSRRICARRKARREANIERERATGKAWREANREHRRVTNRAHRAAHPEYNRAAAKAWSAANPEKLVVYSERRRARKLAAPGAGVSAKEWRTILAESLGLCAYCNERKPLTMDHVEPLALGGAHEPANVVAACGQCNSSKRDTPLIVWMARRQRRAA